MSDEDKMFAIVIRIGIILLIPLILAGIVLLVMQQKMKSVADAAEASAYVAGDLELLEQTDMFSHQTEVRRKIEEDDSDETSSRSSGGGSSTSSKF